MNHSEPLALFKNFGLCCVASYFYFKLSDEMTANYASSRVYSYLCSLMMTKINF